MANLTDKHPPFCRVCLSKNNYAKPFKIMQYVIDVADLIFPGMTDYLHVNQDSSICNKCYFFLLSIDNFRTQIIENHRFHWSNGIMNCNGCSTNKGNFEKFLSMVNSKSILCQPPINNNSLQGSDISEHSILPNHCSQNLQPEINKSLPLKKSTMKRSVINELRAKRIKKTKTKNNVQDNIILNDLNDINAISENETEWVNFQNFLGNTPNPNIKILSDVVVQPSKNPISQNNNTLKEVRQYCNDDLNKENENSNSREEIIDEDSSDVVTITINDVLNDENDSPVSSQNDPVFSDDDDDQSNSRSSVIVSNMEKIPSDYAKVVVKSEFPQDENPGFFNRKNQEGFYDCRLCLKKYKTSLGLYQHTRSKHKEIKFHHCNFCNFFSLWKSALVRHNLMYHSEKFEDPSQTLHCYHCSFTSLSKTSLSEHILKQHAKQPESCALCNKQFSSRELCDEHVHSVHMLSVQGDCSEICVLCCELVDDLQSHNQEVHDIEAQD